MRKVDPALPSAEALPSGSPSQSQSMLMASPGTTMSSTLTAIILVNVDRIAWREPYLQF